ncbi:MAG: hypothetical protein HY231_11020 [Acidobacteria bacterium]|nr:hypothetical protein [Acidobacteriota bacterium]
MNKSKTTKFNVGDEVSYAQPSGMLYGEVIKIVDASESGAIEIHFEDGRKEVKKVKDSALNLLRRASGKSEEEERHSDRQKLRDLDLEKVIRSEQRRRW